MLPSSHDIIWHWLRQGWRYRGLHKWPASERRRYSERVKREMDLIESKDFVDYFLIVSDLVRYAKNCEYAVGPARGSAAASLVCWLLRITEVDPMLYPNLVFERFIDVSRSDLPDIDLDFESECRFDLYNYCVGKYGSDCVANIGTFTYYRAKNSLDDVARVHRIPAWEVGTIKDRIIVRSSGDLRASDTIQDTAEQFADVAAVFERHPELSQSQELEGNVKGQSVHSAGLVLASGPLRRIAPVYGRVVAGDLREVMVFDKYDAERQGMLKIDILGLSTMSMISQCLKWIGMTLPELYALPLDDEAVFDAFRANDVIGIFQFDGLTQKGVCGQLKPDNFDELCDINALARPGPLHNGAVTKYVDIKRGSAVAESLHPLFDVITASTHGQAVYQEQILRTVTEIGNFDWTSASYIRRIMTRKIGEQEFRRQGDKFAHGAAENGVPEDVALKIWGKCVTAGSYAFNAAHCVSYAMIGYWCMWLKVYHPHEFYAASLTHTATAVDKKRGVNKPIDMIRDAEQHGVKVLPPDLAESRAGWTPVRQGVRMGFTQIPGIGQRMAETIMEWREESGTREFAGWDSLSGIKGVGPKTIERIKEFVETEDPYGSRRMGRNIAAVIAQLRDDPNLTHLPIPTHTAAQFQQDAHNKSAVWVGTIHARNLRDLYEYHMSRTGNELDPATVKDPHLSESIVLHGKDTTEAIGIIVSRWKYPALKKMLWDLTLGEDVVLVRGHAVNFANHMIKATDIWAFECEEE